MVRRFLPLLSLVLTLASGVVAPANATSAVRTPPTPGRLPAAIEPLADYVPQDSCDPTVKPGAAALGRLLVTTYPNTTFASAYGCGSNGPVSEHYEGRAVDWMDSMRDATQAAQAQALLNWLLVRDAAGHPFANARRLGVMYIVFNNRIWGAWDGAWHPHSRCAGHPEASWDSTCHRNHMHISLSWEGAMGRTSFWSGRVAAAAPGSHSACRGEMPTRPCHHLGVEQMWSQLRTPDGRSLDVVSAGSEDGMPLLFHGGTPFAAVLFEPVVEVATAQGLRFVTYSRPGYASSDPQPGRSVADVAADVTAVLDALGASRFVTIGWSGGGPHALACAALLPDRCLAAASIAGVAPYPAAGLDWLAGMGEENVEEFGAALDGEDALVPYLDGVAAELAQISADDVAAALGGLVSEVDKASLTGAFAEWLAAVFRKAVSRGVAGWRDDDLAFTKPWGFAPAEIERPVAIWQGDQDRMVPFDHGRWLADQVPTARSHLLSGEGHLSLAVGAFGQIVDDLIRLAR